MIRVRQIEVLVTEDNDTKIIKNCAKKLNISTYDIIDFKINKKSLDARKKPNLYYIYELDLNVKNEEKLLKNKKLDIIKVANEKYIDLKKGNTKLKEKIVIVGTGPAGLFNAYLLAQNGYKPLIIERGEKVEERIESIEDFLKTGILNINSNVQFGEGGAGTFSDGKLTTGIKDLKYRKELVLDVFIECGAPKEIAYLNKPHIGTDLLRNVIINMREKIIKMGGVFRYNTCLTDIVVENSKIKAIKVNEQEIINCEILVLAIGHSARDTFEMLLKNNLEMVPKPFAIGIRIEHKQTMINMSQYGIEDSSNLGAASYKLTNQTKNGRGVYSFCMCPGGYVVNSSSEKGMLAVNGMSNHARNSENANSAIIVTVTSSDFGNDPIDGINFQRKIEEKAFNLCNGKIPVQLYSDYKNNIKSTSFKSILPVTKGTYSLANINEIFPDYINESLVESIEEFNKKIKGFSSDDAIISAVESRTSSPVKIIRNDLLSSNIENVYPCGEGAGYAGGIVSAAIDGIKVAEVIISQFDNSI